MSDIDINRVQQNIKELQDQNAIDFQQWKRLGQEIERLEEKIKTTDKHYNLLMKKIKADYESLKKIIIDENVQVQLNNKIEKNKSEINKKVSIETFDNSVNSINEQLETNTRELDNKISLVNNNKADKNELDVERQRINSLVKNTGASVNDAELQDIRIDGDGETHESAGDSVRSQFNSLKEKVVKQYSSNSLWELGGIDGATGVNEKREDRFRTVSYIAHNIDSIKDTTNGGLVTFAWDKDGNYIGTWDGSTFGTSSTWVFNANIKGYRELYPSYEFKVITRGVIDLDSLIITQHSSGDIDEDFKRKGATVDSYKTGKRFETIECNLSDIKESVDNDLYKGADITTSLKWRSGSSATNTGNLVLNEDITKITLPKVMNLGISTITPKDGYQIYKLISDHEINNGDVLSNWTAYGYTSDSYTTKKDEYILIKITATDGSALNVNNISDYITIVQNQNPYQYIDAIISENSEINTFNNIEYPNYSKFSVPNFPNHDITFVDGNLWAFDKPTEGGLKVYNSEFSQIGSANTQFYFNKKAGGTAELEMKSVDFNNNNRVLLVGNGSSKYVKGDSFLYLFYESEKWLSQGGTIDFSNCGAYTEIDVSALGDKCYAFWNSSCGADDQIFVSLNMFKDIYLIRLGKGGYNLGNGTMKYIDDNKYNGTYQVLNHWEQKNFITGEFGQHGGQYYNGHLYLVNNDNRKNQIYRCVLKANGSLQFDVLELAHYLNNGELAFRYIDGLAIKDGIAFGSPLISNNSFVTAENKEVLKIKID